MLQHYGGLSLPTVMTLPPLPPKAENLFLNMPVSRQGTVVISFPDLPFKHLLLTGITIKKDPMGFGTFSALGFWAALLPVATAVLGALLPGGSCVLVLNMPQWKQKPFYSLKYAISQHFGEQMSKPNSASGTT